MDFRDAPQGAAAQKDAATQRQYEHRDE